MAAMNDRNRPDTVFQPLETFFPTIGNFFSNRWKTAAACLVLAFAAAGRARAGDPPAALALQLDSEKQWAQAALEFRRLALGESDGERAAGWYWMAAREYGRDGDHKRAWKYIGRAEDADGGRAIDLPLAWLRARQSEADKDWSSAAFYYESLHRKAEDRDGGDVDNRDGWLAVSARGAAAAHLREADHAAALAALDGLPAACSGEADASRDAIRGYAARGDKRPWVGGVLGIVPGMGYAYSGEWGNMVRSMVLNGLFLWAMAETAIDDEWGLFGVCTFMELTWYTGSIYGGIDAAHRHNAARLDGVVRAVQGDGDAEVEKEALPLVRLKFRF